MVDFSPPGPWIPLKTVPQQIAWTKSKKRFNVVWAGRRSQKTWLAKRKLVIRALFGTPYQTPTFFAAAPTFQQAKRIYWQDLKAMLPKEALASRPSETELMLELVNGSRIFVTGLDKPERIEGQPIDGGIIDEYANCKADSFPAHIRPALADRNGWCDMIGVPEGYNHFYEMSQRGSDKDFPDWAGFTWFSEAVLPKEEIEAAKRDLPEAIYRQEYQAEFISFTGRAYYAFDRAIHAEIVAPLYNPANDLILCLDFNRAPGVAVICQELIDPVTYDEYTAVIGEVWIEQGSNTKMVIEQFLSKWQSHSGSVHVYGDQTGGSERSAQLLGSDWDIVESMLKLAYPRRIRFDRPGFNPSEVARLNAMNTRLHSMAGRTRLKIDPNEAPHTLDDLEQVNLTDDGKGKIDKRNTKISHLSDALGYYIFSKHPIVSHMAQVKVQGF